MIIRKEDWIILDKSKKYFLFSAIIFFVSFFLGITFSVFYPALAKEALDGLIKTFSFLLEFSPLEMGLFLFLNNSVKVFLFMILGIIFTIPTIFFLFFNGWVLGYVVGISFSEIGLKGVFYSVFLHGIFELLALFIGASLGILMGILFYKEAKTKKLKIFPFSHLLKNILVSSIRIFLCVILPLLFLAALIETYLIYFH